MSCRKQITNRYGDLVKQKVQRFATLQDLDENECTIEEREEYEPYVMEGAVIFAGVDYKEILTEAEKEADVILWDGGNNDEPFIRPDIQVCVIDPLRPGHECLYYPGECNVRSSDILLINKIDTASLDDIMTVRSNLDALNPSGIIVEAASPLTVDNPNLIRGKRVLVVEDGPTLTHGGMTYGAGTIAARRFGAAEIIDPRPFIVGSLHDTFETYPDVVSFCAPFSTLFVSLRWTWLVYPAKNIG